MTPEAKVELDEKLKIIDERLDMLIKSKSHPPMSEIDVFRRTMDSSELRSWKHMEALNDMRLDVMICELSSLRGMVKAQAEYWGNKKIGIKDG